MEILKHTFYDSFAFLKSNKLSLVVFLLLSIATQVFSGVAQYYSKDSKPLFIVLFLFLSIFTGLYNIVLLKNTYYKKKLSAPSKKLPKILTVLLINLYLIFLLVILLIIIGIIFMTLVFLINKIIKINFIAMQLLTTFIPFLFVISLFVLLYKILYFEESIIIHGKMRIIDYFNESKKVRNLTGKSTLVLFLSFFIITICVALLNFLFKNNIPVIIIETIVLMIFNTLYTITLSSIYWHALYSGHLTIASS